MPFNKKEYDKLYSEKNRDKINQRRRERYKLNPEPHKNEVKKYYENNKDRVKHNVKEWESNNLEKSHKNHTIGRWVYRGVKSNDWNALYEYYCLTTHCEYCDVELCEGYEDANRRCLDHDHETGEVRGILCNTCNSRDVFNGK